MGHLNHMPLGLRPQASGVIMGEGMEDLQVPEGADIYSRTVSADHGMAIAHMNS